MTRSSLRRLVVLALAVFAPLVAGAGSDADERARIARERDSAQRRYDVAERACQDRFAVTACTEDARRERREALQRLRREETLLDEAQRRQRAAERVEAIRRKVSEEARSRSPADKAPRDEAGRTSRLRPEPKAPQDAASAVPALRRGRVTVREKTPVPAAERSAQEVRNRASYEARQRAAREHEEATQRHNEERVRSGKPPAAPLPVPSGAGR